jgi:hypothetical protein
MTSVSSVSPATDVQDAFAEFFLDETSALDLLLPNNEPMLYQGNPVSVRLFGPATTEFSKAKAATEKDASKRVLAAIGAKNGSRKLADDPEAETEVDIKFLVAVTDAFINFPYPGGPEAIYREPRLLYIANQVRAHLNSLGNFFKPGSKPCRHGRQ